MADRQLTTEEADAYRLPRGGCCCPDHPHDWYQRDDAENGWWLECNACGGARELAPPASEADCKLIGAGDGSVMVYCQPCRSCLAPRASTLNAALGFWEEHQEEAHEPRPAGEWSAPPGPDPWLMPDAAAQADPPPF